MTNAVYSNNWLLQLIVLFCIGVFSFYALSENHISFASELQLTGNQPSNVSYVSSISVLSERSTYVVGQTINIFGYVYDQNGKGLDTTITVQVLKIADNVTVLERNVQTHNGEYRLAIPTTTDQGPGLYEISVKPSTDPTIYSILIIELQDLFETRAFIMFYFLGGGGFVGLMIVILVRQIRVGKPLEQVRSKRRSLEKRIESLKTEPSRDSTETPYKIQELRYEIWDLDIDITVTKSRDKNYEMCRFICLSLIALAPIVGLLLTNVEITPTAPIGLITKSMSSTDIQNITRVGTQWMVNIGGDPIDNYNAGIQVPVNVFIFGIAGAYLRFLYKTATERSGESHLKNPPQKNQKNNKNDEEKISTEIIESKDFFYDSLKDIALFFLSPLLAIAVWLILWQGGMTSTFTLAAVSFGVGLVTNDIVNFIIGFMKRITSVATVPTKAG